MEARSLLVTLFFPIFPFQYLTLAPGYQFLRDSVFFGFSLDPSGHLLVSPSDDGATSPFC